MTEKRFYVAKSNLIDGYCVFDKEKKYAFSPKPREADCLNDAHILNELHERNEVFLKMLENQSYIIDRLESELLKHQLKKPIVLTKEDLEIMGRAISYYTHGEYPR